MELDFSVDVDTDGVTRVIRLAGELDMATAPQVRAAFAVPIRETIVVVDLTELSFMASAGIGELMVARERSMAEGWTLRLRGVKGIVANVLRITGVDEYFTIEP
jgi:anti-sigma B factor antagonist